MMIEFSFPSLVSSKVYMVCLITAAIFLGCRSNGILADTSGTGDPSNHGGDGDSGELPSSYDTPGIYWTDQAPIIDGQIEAVWDQTHAFTATSVVRGVISSAADLSLEWRALWQATHLYILVVVQDDTRLADSGAAYHDDTIELFLDGDNNKGTSYDGANDWQLFFRVGDNTISAGTNSIDTVSGVVFQTTQHPSGYVLEVAISWTDVGVTPVADNRVGIDVQVDDDDDGGERDTKLAWHATSDDAWSDPSTFGEARLLDGLDDVCQPTTCTAEGAYCGTISDGCGGQLQCGDCGDDQICNASNRCQDDTFPTNPHNDKSPLGTNLNWTVDWSSEIKYVDIMKQSRPWVACSPSGWNDGGTLDTDSDGWIRSLASNQTACALMMRDVPMVPAGQYIVLYDGEGALSYSRMGSPAVRNAALSSPGRDVLDVPENAPQGISVCIQSTNPDDYLRNIRVLLPGGVCSNDRFRHCQSGSDCQSPGICRPFEETYQTQVFYPVFLNDIKEFSVVRFMDMQHTNNSPVQDWSDRKRLTAATYSGSNGVPVEVLVDLANTLEADPWFCMPHLATDDYMREFATYVKSALNPNLSVYIEYSNETWNDIFNQTGYVNAQGVAAGLGTDDPDETPDEYLAGNLYTAQRTVEMIEIWEDVFGGAEQLVRVMPGFYLSTWITDKRMGFEYEPGRYAYEKIDAFAIAPYFGHGVSGSSLDSIFSAFTSAVADVRSEWNAQNERMGYWSNQAGGRTIELITYEAGQHMQSSVVDVTNRDLRMGDIYTTYLNNWKDDVGNLMVMYTSCMKFGDDSAWGLLEYTGQMGSPKYDAVIAFIRAH